MKNKIHFETLGCRLNQDETEGAARVFFNSGFVPHMEAVMARSAVDNDVVLSIINTCTVTAKAEQKARRLFRLMAEKYPEAPVLVTGCYAELDVEEICAVVPGRICVLPGSKKFILSLLGQAMGNGGELSVLDGKFSFDSLKSFIDKKISEYKDVKQRSVVLNGNSSEKILDPFTLYTPIFEKHSRASLKIQDGCNNECTFCRIHLARGKALSLDVETVISRILDLEKQGAGEIVFTGVNLSQYKGLNSDGKFCNFNELLNIVLQRTSSSKFRISSFYPQHITEELCETLKNPRIQPFFHLSIQSGSDEILRNMARPYNAEQVYNAVRLLRQAKDNPFISCDIIAGFPGESEADFELTRKMCEDLHFSWIHAFPFSPRKGTKAFSMKGQVQESIKGERVKWLTENAVNEKCAYIKSCSGKEYSAIVENSRAQRLENDSSKKRMLHAVTENYLHVQLVLPDDEQTVAPGTVIRVKITEALEENIRSGKEIEASGTFEGIE